jgi:hypothetical protein
MPAVEHRQQLPQWQQFLRTAISVCDRRIRLEKPFFTPATDIRTISSRLARLRQLGPPYLLMAALLLLTGGHRGSSIATLQLRDVVLMDRMSPSVMPSDCTTITPAMCSTPLQIAIVFRDTKTGDRIGAYALHIQLPPVLVSMLAHVALASLHDQVHQPRHLQFLFGRQRAQIMKKVASILPFRTTRRLVLRYLAWDLGLPASDVLLFSRHTTVKQLTTYLGAGAFTRDEMQTTVAASAEMASLWFQ